MPTSWMPRRASFGIGSDAGDKRTRTAVVDGITLRATGAGVVAPIGW